jgi:DNA-binding response OmpR family regulator
MLTDEKLARLADVLPALTVQSGLLFIALAEAKGRYLTYDRLAEALEERNLDKTGVPSAVSKARKRLPDGFAITNKSGVGYRLEAPAGWRPPWWSDPGQIPTP